MGTESKMLIVFTSGGVPSRAGGGRGSLAGSPLAPSFLRSVYWVNHRIAKKNEVSTTTMFQCKWYHITFPSKFTTIAALETTINDVG